MQLGLLALVVFLSFMDYADSLRTASGRRHRRISTELPPSCTRGCELCSEYNGCLRCLPRLFILLERNDIRQIGVCLASCPVGYFGVRNPDMNKCNKCKIDNCEACFSRNFCTKCKEGLYSHKGRCYSSCPEGFVPSNGTTECTSAVQCELGEWSLWGPCMKKNKTCGFKKGSQARVREPLQAPSPDTAALSAAPATDCASETENRKCTVQKKVPCGKGDRGKNKNERREEQRNKESKENSRSRSREAKDGAKGGGKKKRPPNQSTTAPTLTPIAIK